MASSERKSARKVFAKAFCDHLFVVLTAFGRTTASRGVVLFLLADDLSFLTLMEQDTLLELLFRMRRTALPIRLIDTAQISFERERQPIPRTLRSEHPVRLMKLGHLGDEDAAAALLKPAAERGISMTEVALKTILRAVQGHPFYLQALGRALWSTPQTASLTPGESSGPITMPDTIDTADARRAMKPTETLLLAAFFDPLLQGRTPQALELLREMALLDEQTTREKLVEANPVEIELLAERLHTNTATVGIRCRELFAYGILRSPRRGEVAFTAHGFGKYLRREPFLPVAHTA